MNRATMPVAMTQQNSNAAEIRAAIQDAQQAAQQAAQEAGRAAAQAGREAALQARDAARQARDAAREARANAGDQGGPARDGNATIVIPSDNGGEDVKIDIRDGNIIVTQGTKHTEIPWREAVPRGAVQITYAVCAMLVAVAFVGPLLRFFLRRHERRAVTAQLSAEVAARLDAMDRNIDTVAVELERVSEGQRFTAKLLEQRPMEHAQRIDR